MQNSTSYQSESPEEVSTCDLYLAAAIITAGIKLYKTTVLGKRVYFHFEKVEDMITKIKREYLARGLQIDALSYADQIKSLKSLCAEIIPHAQGARR